MVEKNTPLVGAHISIAGGLDKSIQRALDINATTMQIFTKNSRQWFAKKITTLEADLFIKTVKRSSLKKIISHAAYIINIGSSNPETEKKSKKALIEELNRCNQLKIPYLILHPGSHTGIGEKDCIKKIAINLADILEKNNGKTKILLETMAGQGSNIGYTFEQLRNIIEQAGNHKNLGVCFDTCHVFAANYDISTKTGYNNVIQQFDNIVGLSRLKAIHLNDSKTPCGSRKDRHESIGKGKIPLATFKRIMKDPNLKNIPKILETPDPSIYAKEIALLKKMC